MLLLLIVEGASSMLADRDRVGADALDHLFLFLAVLYKFARIDRRLQLLQFLQESQVLVTNFGIPLLCDFYVERLAIYHQIGTG